MLAMDAKMQKIKPDLNFILRQCVNVQTFLPPCAMSLTVKRLIIIQNINILNKCCSYFSSNTFFYQGFHLHIKTVFNFAK